MNTEKNKYRIFNKLINEGKQREAVRFLTDRTGGEVIGPNVVYSSTGSKVLEILEENILHQEILVLIYYQNMKIHLNWV